MTEYKIHQQQVETNRFQSAVEWASRYWFHAILTLFVLHLFVNDGVNVKVNLDGQALKTSGQAAEPAFAKAQVVEVEDDAFSIASFSEGKKRSEDSPAVIPTKSNSSDFKNLSFVLSPDLAIRRGVSQAIVNEKMDNCREYVERFAATAMSEMKKFGIPASITLAQGLIETDAGGSRLATESNNHFGIKCRSKCRGCTCRNYSDDDVYDMFRVFPSAWESFREHSQLLQIDRYKHLKKLGTTDYKGWARGLKRAGYATDKNYDKKLIQIIEALDLHQFDK